MKSICTITLNPVFDEHYDVPDFCPGKENAVASVERYAGGKGVNTARALHENRVEALAYVLVGTENGEEYLARLRDDGVSCRAFFSPGRIREGITIHPGQGRETRLAVNTFRPEPAAFEALAQALLAENLSELLVSFSGTLPLGLEKARVKGLLEKLIEGGARLAVDSASFSKEDLQQLHPWFIKPNEQEIERFCGASPASREEAGDAAKELVRQGVSEAVMISLGALGAAYAEAEAVYLMQVPALENPLSTIGAGDSTVAGFLASVAQGYDKETCLRFAAAYGTAACMSRGTQPPRAADVNAVLENVRVYKR